MLPLSGFPPLAYPADRSSAASDIPVDGEFNHRLFYVANAAGLPPVGHWLNVLVLIPRFLALPEDAHLAPRRQARLGVFVVIEFLGGLTRRAFRTPL